MRGNPWREWPRAREGSPSFPEALRAKHAGGWGQDALSFCVSGVVCFHSPVTLSPRTHMDECDRLVAAMAAILKKT